MKKFLLTLFVIIVVAGVLGGAGFAGYRYGYMQAASAKAPSNSNAPLKPPFARGNDFGWNQMPMHDGRHGMGGVHHQGWGSHGGFGMMPYGGGFGFFSPIHFLVQFVILGFLIWLGYKFFKGWRISFSQTNATPTDTQQKNG